MNNDAKEYIDCRTKLRWVRNDRLRVYVNVNGERIQRFRYCRFGCSDYDALPRETNCQDQDVDFANYKIIHFHLAYVFASFSEMKEHIRRFHIITLPTRSNASSGYIRMRRRGDSSYILTAAAKNLHVLNTPKNPRLFQLSCHNLDTLSLQGYQRPLTST